MIDRFLKWIYSFFIKEQRNAPRERPIVVNIPTRENLSDIAPGDQFIDISHHEYCNFDKLEFKDVIFKATDGVDFDDPEFLRCKNWAIGKKLRWTAYHFYRTGHDWRDQAEAFIDLVGLDDFKLMSYLPILDYETTEIGSNQDLDDLIDAKEDVLKFCKYFHGETGLKLRIYTSEYFLKKIKFDKRFLEYCECPWVAKYPKKLPIDYKSIRRPRFSGPWENIWAWQYSSKAHVKGVDGKVDINYFLNP